MGLVEAEIPGAAARESMRGQCLGFGPEIRNGSHFGFILHERAVRYGSLPGKVGFFRAWQKTRSRLKPFLRPLTHARGSLPLSVCVGAGWANGPDGCGEV